MVKNVVPYAQLVKSKKEQVSEMFDDISPRYDLLNRVLSLGIDRGWRKKVVGLLKIEKPRTVLDVATGTGDLAIAEAAVKPEKIIGVDISEGMLSIARQKVKKAGLESLIEIETGDSENLRFTDNKFDAATVAFGVRNFENLRKGLGEIYRVLRPGGLIIILEFSQPVNFPFKQMYFFYFKNVLPLVGRMVSKNKAAYTYLPESVSQFPFGKEFAGILSETGFKETSWKALTFGICTIYTGRK